MTLTEALKEIDALLQKIKSLESENNQFADIGKLYSEIKTETIKEFAERLKQRTRPTLEYCEVVLESDIDNLVKEMVGDTE